MASGNPHQEIVDAWAAHVGRDLPPQRTIDALDEAFERLWRRGRRTLGDITMAAIADRVLHTACQRFSVLEGVTTGAGGFQLDALRARADDLDSADLLEAARCVLTEFLTVLGKLVAEILTPALHAELMNDGAALDVDDGAALDAHRENEGFRKDEEP